MEYDILKEITYNIQRESASAYPKLQELLERILKKFFAVSSVDVSKESLKAKVHIACIKKGISTDCENVLIRLNHYANNIKHSNGLNTPYNKDFIIQCCQCLNELSEKLLHDSSDYRINLSSCIVKGSPTVAESTSCVTKSSSFIAKDAYDITANFPIGTSSQDFGFSVTYKTNPVLYADAENFEASIYAIIFNFLQRSSRAEKNRYLLKWESINNLSLKFSAVFRAEIVLLLMIKTGYLNDHTISLSATCFSKTEFQIAAENINHYADNIARLCQKELHPILLLWNPRGLSIGYEQGCDFCITDFHKKPVSSERDYWFAQDLLYNVNETDCREIMEEFLFDFFGYQSFRPGQYEAIVKSFNNHERSITIMPTGAGKSLIFYMNALLSPCITVVISPTSILAQDQVRNLLTRHHIDDCCLCSNADTLKPNHKLIYILPEAFQSYTLVKQIITYNVEFKISNIIIDEIHTLCNWSHDFRPDYLLLCRNLFMFADNCRYLGFTATANYKIITDLSTQLKIDFSCIIQPLSFHAGNFEFNFIKCTNEEDQLAEFMNCINRFLNTRVNESDKLIIFTHTLDESKQLFEHLSASHIYNTNLFDSEHTYSYEEFVNGNKHILIADSSIGIGINLPDVTHVLHYGIPNSKSQYVQEIGRANRTLNKGKSIVLFIDDSLESDSTRELLSLNTPVDRVLQIAQEGQTDFARLYYSILGKIDTKMNSSQIIWNIYRQIQNVSNYIVVSVDKSSDTDRTNLHKYLYVLCILGFVENWYVRHESDYEIILQIEVNNPDSPLAYAKENVIEYLSQMNSSDIFTYRIILANSVKQVIYVFQSWFYDEFLRYHREQILNAQEFFQFYAENKDRQSILDELKDYFSSTAQVVNEHKDKLLLLSFDEIVHTSFTATQVHAAEELITANYNVKFDLIIFLFGICQHQSPNMDRFERIIRMASHAGRRALLENLYVIYAKLSDEQKLEVINILLPYYNLKVIVDSIYSKQEKDLLFYGILVSKINNILGV